MSSTLYSDSKLQFYPTELMETIRILGMCFRMKIKDTDKLKESIGKEYYNNAYEESRKKYTQLNTSIFNSLLEERKFNLIQSNFEMDYYNKTNNQKIIISDLFCGEGNFLSLYKEFASEDLKKKIVLLGNEIETNRYLKVKNNKNIDLAFNKSFESLEIPKRFISLNLYNPPYGYTNKIRNSKHYLQMILDRDILEKDSTTVFILKKDDIIDSIELITKHFEIDFRAIYKTHREEYEKYKQIILIGNLRENPLDDTNIFQANQLKNNIEKLKTIVESEPVFNIEMYGNFYNRSYPEIDYKLKVELFKKLKSFDKKKYISNTNNSNWSFIKKETSLKDEEKDKLTIPKDLKIGEISNLISSSYINGKIKKSNGTGKHIVVGGTIIKRKSTLSTTVNEQGESITEEKILKYSQPYLNILCNINGKVQIKELSLEPPKQQE